ncbi:MAG: DinB family protein [Planctomycetaceae bacterium]|nr:DinB family protein [Planctomycetaceae bacterium]
MSAAVISLTTQLLDFSRERTLGTLTAIEKMPDPNMVLGWRPGPGRAHIAWQLMHVGITEELFATDRFRGTAPAFADLVPRFKGGSTPDDNIPGPAEIRDVLAQTREHLLGTLASLTEADLATIPAALAARSITIGKALQIVVWHEAHHQGQAHITLNLYKASQA